MQIYKGKKYRSSKKFCLLGTEAVNQNEEDINLVRRAAARPCTGL